MNTYLRAAAMACGRERLHNFVELVLAQVELGTERVLLPLGRLKLEVGSNRRGRVGLEVVE